jgi:hypothetical protein
LVLDEVANVIVKNKKIARWTFTTKEQLKKLNLGNEGNPKQVLINAMLPISFQTKIKKLLGNYHDVFAWSYKDLMGIPREICEHKIELVVNVQPIKQRQYRMNPNYALKVKKDIDKLLDAIFIYPIETTYWLFPLVIGCIPLWMVTIVITKLKWRKITNKMAFISKWGAYAYNIMPFGLCDAHATFQKIVTKMLKPYLNKFI